MSVTTITDLTQIVAHVTVGAIDYTITASRLGLGDSATTDEITAAAHEYGRNVALKRGNPKLLIVVKLKSKPAPEPRLL